MLISVRFRVCSVSLSEQDLGSKLQALPESLSTSEDEGAEQASVWMLKADVDPELALDRHIETLQNALAQDVSAIHEPKLAGATTDVFIMLYGPPQSGCTLSTRSLDWLARLNADVHIAFMERQHWRSLLDEAGIGHGGDG